MREPADALPTITYPPGPAATAAVTVRPGPSNAAGLPAAVQVRPSGEPITAGPGRRRPGRRGRGAADGEPAGRAVRHPGQLPAAPPRRPQAASARRGARWSRRRPRPTARSRDWRCPTATSVAPAAAIADTCTGRPLPPPKSAAADRAGGNPAASADGAAVPPPLFAPRTTTPATPTAIAASSGTARLVSQLRARIAARVSLASRAGRPGSGRRRRPRATAAATADRTPLTAAGHGSWPAGSRAAGRIRSPAPRRTHAACRPFKPERTLRRPPGRLQMSPAVSRIFEHRPDEPYA